jgi:hypothetical protein
MNDRGRAQGPPDKGSNGLRSCDKVVCSQFGMTWRTRGSSRKRATARIVDPYKTTDPLSAASCRVFWGSMRSCR